MKIETTKTIIYIVLGLAAIGTTVISIDKYFAKQSDVDKSIEKVVEAVDKVAERFDIGTSDDMIFRQQQQIRHWKAKVEFEERKQPPTDMEKEVIEQEHRRLKELEEQRREKIQKYERRK